MHENLFYVSPASGPPLAIEQFFTFPPLYLASGINYCSHCGLYGSYGDLQIKARVDSGQMLDRPLNLQPLISRARQERFRKCMN